MKAKLQVLAFVFYILFLIHLPANVMKLNEIASKKPGVTYAVCGVIVTAAILLIVRNSGSSRSLGSGTRWAYDLNTKQIFVDHFTGYTPITTESGSFNYPRLGEDGAGVEAHIYSCGEPAAVRAGMTSEELAAIDAKIVFLSRQVKNEAATSDEDDPVLPVELLSDVNGERWVPETSPPGIALRDKVLEKCPNGKRSWKCAPI